MKTFISRSALSAALLVGFAASATDGSTGQYLDDAAITTKVNTELLASEGPWSNDIRVQTVEGVVHLMGYAWSEQDRQHAGEIARSVAGVNEVHNDLRVR